MAPTDITVNSFNTERLKIAHRKCHSSKSIEAVVYHSLSVTYPAEFLNSLGSFGLSPHKLDLRVGATIMFEDIQIHQNSVMESHLYLR